LKGRTEKYVAAAAEQPEGLSDEELAVWRAAARGSGVKWSALLRQFPDRGPLLKRWLKDGYLAEQQRVEDRRSV
jgi:hypothetical protein